MNDRQQNGKAGPSGIAISDSGRHADGRREAEFRHLGEAMQRDEALSRTVQVYARALAQGGDGDGQAGDAGSGLALSGDQLIGHHVDRGNQQKHDRHANRRRIQTGHPVPSLRLPVTSRRSI